MSINATAAPARGAAARSPGSCAPTPHQRPRPRERTRIRLRRRGRPGPGRGQGTSSVNNLNSILLEGNLCREPELRYTTKGTPTCTLVVSSVRTYKLEGERHEEVSFFESTTFGKLATVCAEHLTKGRGVRVVGRIKQERWDDADGNARCKVVIVAEHVEFQPRRAAHRPAREIEAVAS